MYNKFIICQNLLLSEIKDNPVNTVTWIFYIRQLLKTSLLAICQESYQTAAKLELELLI